MANGQWLKAKIKTKSHSKSEAIEEILCVTQWRKAQHSKPM